MTSLNTAAIKESMKLQLIEMQIIEEYNSHGFVEYVCVGPDGDFLCCGTSNRCTNFLEDLGYEIQRHGDLNSDLIDICATDDLRRDLEFKLVQLPRA